MSFNNTAREDFWQSTSRNTISERCKAIINQELLSDVKFVVRESQGGSQNKTIPAHKFVLAISSPVFYAMFYGELAETKDSVEISDCEYESLLELFRFIYSDEANLTPDNVMQLMYLATKYMLPSLADKCSAYLKENLSESNVFTVLPEAQKYEEKELINLCWKVIEKETEEAVKSDGFATIERSILEEIIEKDSLTIKEVELFKAVDRWAEKECEKQGLVAEGSEKRRILGERIVKGVRFPVMEQKEFADVVLDSGVLNYQEVLNMVKYFNSVLKVPLEFPKTKRSGTPPSCAATVAQNLEYNPYFDEEVVAEEQEYDPYFDDDVVAQEQENDPYFDNDVAQEQEYDPYFDDDVVAEEQENDPYFDDDVVAEEQENDPYFDDDVAQEQKNDPYFDDDVVAEEQEYDPYFDDNVVAREQEYD